MYGSLSKYIEDSKWAFADVSTLKDGTTLFILPSKEGISTLFKRKYLHSKKESQDAIALKVRFLSKGRSVSIYQILDQLQAYYNNKAVDTKILCTYANREGKAVVITLTKDHVSFSQGPEVVPVERNDDSIKAFTTRVVRQLFRML